MPVNPGAGYFAGAGTGALVGAPLGPVGMGVGAVVGAFVGTATSVVHNTAERNEELREARSRQQLEEFAQAQRSRHHVHQHNLVHVENFVDPDPKCLQQ